MPNMFLACFSFVQKVFLLLHVFSLGQLGTSTRRYQIPKLSFTAKTKLYLGWTRRQDSHCWRKNPRRGGGLGEKELQQGFHATAGSKNKICLFEHQAKISIDDGEGAGRWERKKELQQDVHAREKKLLRLLHSSWKNLSFSSFFFGTAC